MAVERADVLRRIAGAYKAGMSAAEFIRQMRDLGLGYRTSDMYADWYAQTGVFALDGVLQYINKDFYPTTKSIADVEWDLSQEYMYKVRVQSQLSPDSPITERFVNILSDVALTIGQIEEAVVEKWAEWEDYTKEAITKVTAWTALHRV